ncbi:MAG: hypothetical protein R3E79_33215 [Caldilineaceae bacterium]
MDILIVTLAGLGVGFLLLIVLIMSALTAGTGKRRHGGEQYVEARAPLSYSEYRPPERRSVSFLQLLLGFLLLWLTAGFRDERSNE